MEEIKPIKADLSRELKYIEIHTFADEHVGDPLSDLNRLKKRIEFVEKNNNAFCILNGDLIDNATCTSIGDTYTQEFNPMKQIEKGVELFKPIKDKILCITNGNHEGRSYRTEGVDITKIISMQLGIERLYCAEGALLFLRFGEQSRGTKETGNNKNIRKMCYTIYATHGRGGGRKEGAKAIRLADMASIVDADIYIHSHTHMPMIMKQAFFRVDKQNSAISKATKLFVNTASNLNYGGYGQVAEFKPTSTDTPIIKLCGTHKELTATL